MTAFVYFVQAGPGGPIKIGFAANVEKRIAELQTGCPHKLSLLATENSEDARGREAELHEQFAALRIDRSEWFRWSPELGEAIVEAARRTRSVRVVTRAVTYDWHKPRCSSCAGQIEAPAECLAGWFDDRGRWSWPFVCHTGDFCDFYHLVVGVRGLNDLTIDTCRRAPMVAIETALRGVAADPASQASWSRWVSIAVGIPFCQLDSTLDLKLYQQVGELLAERVPLATVLAAALDEARSRLRGESL